MPMFYFQLQNLLSLFWPRSPRSARKKLGYCIWMQEAAACRKTKEDEFDQTWLQTVGPCIIHPSMQLFNSILQMKTGNESEFSFVLFLFVSKNRKKYVCFSVFHFEVKINYQVAYLVLELDNISNLRFSLFSRFAELLVQIGLYWPLCSCKFLFT